MRRVRVTMDVLCGALFALALVRAVQAHWSVPVLPIDDGYIHLRYARNILSGVGPFYNAGQHVMGSSSPLYVLWLTLVGALSGVGNLLQAAVRANALWYLAAMVSMAGLMRRMAGTWSSGFLLAAGAALFSPMLAVSTGAMESYLWGALVLGALWAWGKRDVLCALLTGLAAVTRPEGLLLLGIWGLCWLWRRPWEKSKSNAALADPLRRHWAVLPALAGGPLLLWIAVSVPLYGSPVPLSVVSKASGLYLMPADYIPRVLRELFRAWSGGGALGWNPPASAAASGKLVTPAQTLLPWAGLLGLLVQSRDKGLRVPVAMLGLLMAFYAIGHTHLLEWYLPLIWLLWYPVVFGGATALARTGWYLAAGQQRAGWALLALPLLLAGTVFGSGPARAAVELARQENLAQIVIDDPVRMRVLAYHSAAEWLNANAPAGARLAATEVGALGWTYSGYIVDACALVSAEALPYIPVPMEQRNYEGDGVIAQALVQDLQPEYVCSMPTFASKSIMVDPWFAAHYRQTASFLLPRELWGATHVLVWERVDPPVVAQQP
ncbi:MAG: hypothetical protein ACOX2L_09140 [Anaerolineae bacterium]|jgi:hypothetical protein|nr:hypothetical protein [Chloroflexota bacterium]